MAETAHPDSAASKLMQQHAADNSHHVTVEDVEDEQLPKHDAPAAADGASSEPAPTWAEPMSAKSAGKQKAQEPTGLDTQSHELFPELGGPKPKVTTGAVPVWSAKSNGHGKTNGAGSANGTPRASTPASGVSTPTGAAAPSLSIPGRNVETLYLEPHHVLPRNQLRRPLPDIIKDSNRKSRANISMSTLGNGKLKLEATGPQDIAQQALRDLVQQIGTKVCRFFPSLSGFISYSLLRLAKLHANRAGRCSNPSRSRSLDPRGHTSLARVGLQSRRYKRNLGPRFSCPRRTPRLRTRSTTTRMAFSTCSWRETPYLLLLPEMRS